ncbi:hypothetical protein [Taibaiella chishuiensis]|uniref:Uncharacterized protein n=1 Tax=Taibaiella chishuiensis TaxID=1434707 RepID=A0A2P8DCK5_9BACT|nr:hypothetical protein [Taibaiella chishuiensis]PSK94958.1 hypothetical protein B0I18_1011121 [Taibaiella chishuiensis]
MSHAVQPEKTNIPSSAAFWTVLIFVGLVIGGVNFVKAMGGDDAHGGGHGAPTEHAAPAAGHGAHSEAHEAPAAHNEAHGTEAEGKGHEATATEHTEAGHAAPESTPAKEEAHH